MLEGPHLLRAALDQKLPLVSILATPEFVAREEDLLSRLPEPPTLVDPRLLHELADSETPRGIVAVAELRRGGVTTLPVRADGLYVFAEGLQDPGNLGALARTCEAAGGTGLALSHGCTDPHHPRSLRASAGSLLRLAVAVGVDPGELTARLTTSDSASPRWLGLVPRGGTDLFRIDQELVRARPTILAVGAEGQGLSHGLLGRLDSRVTIPLAGSVESLNATVAAAVALFELRRRQ